MAEEQKKLKLETVKESSNYLRGTIAEHLARDTLNFRSDTGCIRSTPREDFAIIRQFYLDMDSRSAGAGQRL